MSTSSTINAINNVTNSYKTFLTSLTEEEFQLKPALNAWSYSEIYFHIFDASIFSLKAIKALSAGMDEGGSLKLVGKAVLFFGGFPPKVRLKAPKSFLDRIKSISREEALELIQTFETKFTFVVSLANEVNKNARIKHPRLGTLNAKQWLRFIEVHLKHHLKQVERTKKALLKIN